MQQVLCASEMAPDGNGIHFCNHGPLVLDMDMGRDNGVTWPHA